MAFYVIPAKNGDPVISRSYTRVFEKSSNESRSPLPGAVLAISGWSYGYPHGAQSPKGLRLGPYWAFQDTDSVCGPLSSSPHHLRAADKISFFMKIHGQVSL